MIPLLSDASGGAHKSEIKVAFRTATLKACGYPLGTVKNNFKKYRYESPSQEEQNDANFSFVAPSSEEL